MNKMILKRFLLNNLEYIGYYIVGFCLIFTGLYIATINNIGTESIVITIGIFIIAWGITRKSGIITNDIAESSLYETIGEFEDRRLNIRTKNNLISFQREKIKNYANSDKEKVDEREIILYTSFSLWKCRTYLNRAMIYKKYFNDKHEDKLIHQVDNLFLELCDAILIGKMILQENATEHLEHIYDSISKLDTFHRDLSIKDNFRRERILNNLKFLKGLINYITDFNRCIIVQNYPPNYM